MRSEFEKTFRVPAHWIEFDEKSNKYYCPYVADAKASEYQSMWKVWQHQQSKVDELQKRVEAGSSLVKKYHSGEIDLFDLVDELEQALKGGGE
ncbi:hypothetical protein MMO38_06630 [Acinetobacter sp. NIPH 1852]|uniref:hypothetical protein n=1 Tax=Acinetobacter sp. NIPH 1852 TaxID=2923428 RepID=UPI001F4A6D71|nr:hypothetical protein [Acinetobacter sp. NIPH 1852]MCH7307815.1 hypothetical protein [Acinetobacter sp. NIPH 1852]